MTARASDEPNLRAWTRRTITDSMEGASGEDFSGRDWSAVVAATLIFGSAYLWIDIALESLAPGVVAAGRAFLR